jgi:hypothetical protein
MNAINYWTIISGIAALFVLFLLRPFPLGFLFALFFFLLSVVLANHLFAKEGRFQFLLFRVDGSQSFLEKIPYLLGGISSLFILLVPSIEIQVQNVSVFSTFLSFSPLLLLKIVFGLFFLSFFPGYVFCRRFLKSSFSYFEKLGLTFALSYCVNAIVGLLLSSLNLVSPISYLISIWLFVIVIVGSGKISKNNQVQASSSTHNLSWETLLLLLTSLTLLIGSYSLTMALGPISGLLSGDIARYMVSTNESFNLGISSYIPWLESYMVTGTMATGLPLIYVYSLIQYLVLLIPCSVFFFMKTLFPLQKKVAAVSAFMVSVLYGMSSLPFLANLIGTPSLFTGYLNGAVQSTLHVFVKIFWANTQSYILWNRTIEYALGLIALGFLFKYLRSGKKKENMTNLLLGVLLLNAAIFTHNLFLTIPILVVVVFYSLFQRTPKIKLAKIFVLTILLFLLFTLMFGSIVVDQVVTLFIYSYFSIVNPNAGLNVILLISILLPIYVALLFRGRLKFRDKLTHNLHIPQTFQRLHIPRPTVVGRWTFSLLFIILSLSLCYLNYNFLNHVSMFSPRPWYVWIAYFSLQIPLIIVYLPRILGRCDRKSLKFLGSFTFSVLVIALLSYLGFVPFLSEGVGSLYLFFLAYPLSCLAALALSMAVPTEKKIVPTTESHKPLIRFSLRKRKIFYILSTFLVVSMAASFLSYTYSIAIDYPQDQYAPRLSSSDADVIQWMHNSLPKDSVIIALSEKSYEALSSILPNKILPIFLGSEGPEGGTWPRNAIMESQVPEAILYSLYQLGATHVFVGSADNALQESNTTFASLLKFFPVAYTSGNVKLYDVPYVLYNDSNYHVISGLCDYPVKECGSTSDGKYSPITISDDEQSSFWSVRALEGNGSIGLPVISDDSSTKVSGNNGLKITVQNGTYARWQITHKYTSLQDWSSQDYITFYWYGADTNKTLSVEIKSDIKSYNYYVYNFIENWTGWKRIIISLQNPSAASKSPPDLARVNEIDIGFWLSSNVAGTFWLDQVTVDVGQWIEQDLAIPSNQLLTEILLSDRLPYSVASDNSLNELAPDNVYFFPYNPYVSQGLLNNLISSVSEGANMVFLNPWFACYNSMWKTSHSIPNILNYTLLPNTLNDVASGIISDEGIINCSMLLPYEIRFENQSGLEIVASFKLSDGSFLPYIVRETVGRGSITFVDISPLTELSELQRNEVINLTSKSLFNSLPSPANVKTLQQLPIPSQTFVDIAFRGTTYDLWRNSDLRGKLFFHSDITAQGDFSILSDYMAGESNQLYVKNLTIIQNDNTNKLAGIMLYDIKFLGTGELSFNSSKAELPNFPTGLYSIINVNCGSTSSLQSIKLTDATISFKRAPDGELETYSGDLLVTAYLSKSLAIRAEQPKLILNGSVEGIIHGAFIYNKYYFYARAQHESAIKGRFTLEVLYSSGVTFTKLSEINDIWGIVNPV